MEWFVSSLKLTVAVYIEEIGLHSKLHLVSGSVVMMNDGKLCIGGAVSGHVSGDNIDIVLFTSDGATLKFSLMDIDLIEADGQMYLNATSIKDKSKVLYISGDENPVRVELSQTL